MMLLCAVALNFAFAQEPGKPMPNQPDPQGNCDEPKPVNPMMLKMKKEFIQESFVIESSKKEAFWNAYNEYEKEILAAHKAQREFRKSNNIPQRMTADSLSTLSDDIILKYYENNFTTKNLIFKAEEKFFNNLKNILTPQQIAQYYLLEKNFHKSATKMDHPHQIRMDAKPMKMEMQMQATPIEKSKQKH